MRTAPAEASNTSLPRPGRAISGAVLNCLRVRSFAIIDELEVELEPGMNVVTGETGAGKSILIDALQLVLGARARPEVVRTGAEQAEIEALFDVGDDPEVRARLEQAGIEVEDELVLRRVVQRTGRSRAYVNGSLAPAGQLAELARGLCDISSQHEHHTLVDPHTHLAYLDAFAELAAAREEMQAAFARLQGARDALSAQQTSANNRVEREDLLRFQIQEIDALGLQPGEEPALKTERERQRHAGRLAAVTGGAEDALYASDEALCARLARIATEIEQAAGLDPALLPLAEQLNAAHTQLEDAARELGSYARGISVDEQRLQELEDRLDAISRLKRKYGGSLDAVLEHRERAAEELAALDRGEERAMELTQALEREQRAAAELARKLSERRKKAAKKLSDAVSKELGSLSMGDAKVTVEVAQPEGLEHELCVDGARLSSTGIDRVEFLIAPNRGEDPQPLRKIASGGELSRAMLALKRVLAGVGPAGLYVFDEVDAGVGGAVAEVIGRKLREVAEHHQVLVITHLPQIAVFAQAHYHVSKSAADGRTRSEIRRLRESEQRDEIARMLGGIKITDKTRAAAREMLREAAGK
jgi:DNA repair protein RecN (Recombination protein N)